MRRLWLACVLLATAGASPPTRTVDRPGEFMPDRHWDVEHLHLAVRVDPAKGTVGGEATHTLSPLGSPTGWVRLHQVALDISEVRVDGAVVQGWHLSGENLDIPVSPGVPHEVAVRWRAEPRLGMHFRNPKTGADRFLEAWTQGEGQDNRYWFPGWDFPNDRFTYSAEITVPEGLMAISNGSQTGVKPAEDGWQTFSYRLEQRLVNYLVMVSVGEYALFEEDGATPLAYVVPKGTSEEVVQRTFSQTSAQLDFFNELLGVSYPYPVYRQVTVQRFLYSGMENTSSTIMDVEFLRHRESDRQLRLDNLMAHELSHQWFGDLLTCYGWRDIWLNEGFATYYAMRWQRHQHGPEVGAALVRRWHRRGLKPENPMAIRGWSRVGDERPARAYYRGGAVLHQLHTLLGPEVFDQAIRTYVARHQDQLVETEQLRRVFEDVSGQHLGWLFDTLVYGKIMPKLSSRWSFRPKEEEKGGTLEVVLRQKDKLQLTVPVDVQVGHIDQGVRTHRVWIEESEARLVLELAHRPDWVAVNPEGGTFAQWTHEQDARQWTAQLLHSPTPFAQLIAGEQLGEQKSEPETVAALVKVLTDPSLHPVFRGKFAAPLGKLRSPEAVAGALLASSDPADEVREPAVRSLIRVPTTRELVDALEDLARSDPHPHVRGIAMRALASHDAERAGRLARRVLRGQPDAFDTVLHESALVVLDTMGDPDVDLDRVLKYAEARWDARIRVEAMNTLKTLIRRTASEDVDTARAQATRVLLPSLADPDVRMRRSVMRTLGQVGDTDAHRALLAFAATTPIEDLATVARAAAKRIRTRDREGSEEHTEQEDFQEVTDRLDRLEKRLKRLEEWRY